MNKKYLISSASVAILAGLALITPAFAATPPQAPMGWGHGNPSAMHGAPMQRPAVVGQVSAVSGTTLTVSEKGFGKNATTTTTYTVDASNATVLKNNATSSVSAIAVGDSIFAQGTLTGTNLVATKIFDGKFGMMGMGMRPGANMPHATSTPMVSGNGEPVVGGKVSAVNGTTISITNSGNTTYTVDVSSAKITKPGVSSAAALNIAVGDEVLVQGSVNGTSITATSVIDQTNSAKPQGKGGIFGSIGSFFSHLFGF